MTKGWQCQRSQSGDRLAGMAVTDNRPRAMRSDVASRLIQKDTQDSTTSRQHGTYIWMRKYPVWRRKSKKTVSTEWQAAHGVRRGQGHVDIIEF